jgi:hypothetical protein
VRNLSLAFRLWSQHVNKDVKRTNAATTILLQYYCCIQSEEWITSQFVRQAFLLLQRTYVAFSLCLAKGSNFWGLLIDTRKRLDWFCFRLFNFVCALLLSYFLVLFLYLAPVSVKLAFWNEKLNWIINFRAGLFPNTSASLVSLPYVNLRLPLRRATGATSQLVGTASAFSRWLFVWYQRSELILLPRKNKIPSLVVGFVRGLFKHTLRFKRVKQCLQTLSLFHPYAVFALFCFSPSCIMLEVDRSAAPRWLQLHAELLSPEQKLLPVLINPNELGSSLWQSLTGVWHVNLSSVRLSTSTSSQLFTIVEWPTTQHCCEKSACFKQEFLTKCAHTHGGGCFRPVYMWLIQWHCQALRLCTDDSSYTRGLYSCESPRVSKNRETGNV